MHATDAPHASHRPFRGGSVRRASEASRCRPLPAARFAICLAVASAGAAHGEVIAIGAEGPVLLRGTGANVITVGDDTATSLAEDVTVGEAAPDVPAPALTPTLAPVVPILFQDRLLAAAKRYDLSPDLLAALIWAESRWQPAALSPKGAVGLGQLMPATARALSVDPREPAANLEGAAHYLRQLLDLFDGDVERALAAYNAGPQRVLKAGGVPAITETRLYVSRIIDRLAAGRTSAPIGAFP